MKYMQNSVNSIIFEYSVKCDTLGTSDLGPRIFPRNKDLGYEVFLSEITSLNSVSYI